MRDTELILFVLLTNGNVKCARTNLIDMRVRDIHKKMKSFISLSAAALIPGALAQSAMPWQISSIPRKDLNDGNRMPLAGNGMCCRPS